MSGWGWANYTWSEWVALRTVPSRWLFTTSRCTSVSRRMSRRWAPTTRGSALGGLAYPPRRRDLRPRSARRRRMDVESDAREPVRAEKALRALLTTHEDRPLRATTQRVLDRRLADPPRLDRLRVTYPGSDVHPQPRLIDGCWVLRHPIGRPSRDQGSVRGPRRRTVRSRPRRPQPKPATGRAPLQEAHHGDRLVSAAVAPRRWG